MFFIFGNIAVRRLLVRLPFYIVNGPRNDISLEAFGDEHCCSLLVLAFAELKLLAVKNRTIGIVQLNAYISDAWTAFRVFGSHGHFHTVFIIVEMAVFLLVWAIDHAVFIDIVCLLEWESCYFRSLVVLVDARCFSFIIACIIYCFEFKIELTVFIRIGLRCISTAFGYISISGILICFIFLSTCYLYLCKTWIRIRNIIADSRIAIHPCFSVHFCFIEILASVGRGYAVILKYRLYLVDYKIMSVFLHNDSLWYVAYIISDRCCYSHVCCMTFTYNIVRDGKNDIITCYLDLVTIVVYLFSLAVLISIFDRYSSIFEARWTDIFILLIQISNRNSYLYTVIRKVAVFRTMNRINRICFKCTCY